MISIKNLSFDFSLYKISNLLIKYFDNICYELFCFESIYMFYSSQYIELALDGAYPSYRKNGCGNLGFFISKFVKIVNMENML